MKTNTATRGTRQPCSYCGTYMAHTTSNCPSDRAKQDRREVAALVREGHTYTGAKYIAFVRRQEAGR